MEPLTDTSTYPLSIAHVDSTVYVEPALAAAMLEEAPTDLSALREQLLTAVIARAGEVEAAEWALDQAKAACAVQMAAPWPLAYRPRRSPQPQEYAHLPCRSPPGTGAGAGSGLIHLRPQSLPEPSSGAGATLTGRIERLAGRPPDQFFVIGFPLPGPRESRLTVALRHF